MNVLKKIRDKFSQLFLNQSFYSRSSQAIDSFKSKFFSFLKADMRRYAFLLVVITVIVVGLFLPAGHASADVGSWLAGLVLDHIVFPVVYIIFWILFYIAYVIAWIGASIISTNLNPYIMTTVLTSDNIYKGWQIFRDVANLLYILVLLLVALGTIFRSDTYNAKKLLPRLIIVAFLMNFSMMLTELVIDFGNILMYGILRMMCPPNSTTCFQDFYSQLMQSIDYLYREFTFLSFLSVTRQGVVGMAIATIYTFVYGLTLVALGVFLLIRIAVLAVLVIISPLAFFGLVAPGLKKISNEWWDKLLSYSLFGPVFALLLYISGLMATTTFTVAPGVTTTNPNLGGMAGLFATIISNIIPLVFLLAIVPITKSMGIMGAGMIMNNTVGLSAAVGGFAGSYAGSRLDRWAASGAKDQRPGVRGKLNRARAYLSPGAWKRAYKASKAEQEHDYDIAAGQLRQTVFDRGPVEHAEDARQREVNRHRQDIKGKNKDELSHLMIKSLDEGMIERAEAISLELASTGDMNEVFTKMKDADGVNYENTQEGFVKFMKEKFEPKLGTDKTGRLMSDIAQLEKKDGNHSFKGTSKYNDKTSKYEIVTDKTKREQKAAEEFGTVESQGKWKTMDSRTLMDQVHNKDASGKVKYKPDGSTDDRWTWGERSAYIFEDMTDKDIDNAWKAKSKHQRRMLEGFEDKDSNDELNKNITKMVNTKYKDSSEEVKAQKVQEIRAKADKLREGLKESIYGEQAKAKTEAKPKEEKKIRRTRQGQRGLGGETVTPTVTGGGERRGGGGGGAPTGTPGSGAAPTGTPPSGPVASPAGGEAAAGGTSEGTTTEEEEEE